jgi:hypothetical protein
MPKCDIQIRIASPETQLRNVKNCQNGSSTLSSPILITHSLQRPTEFTDAFAHWHDSEHPTSLHLACMLKMIDELTDSVKALMGMPYAS